MEKNKKKITINDIAKLTNVSKTTISRFLNGKYEGMSETTKERIEKIVLEVNYRPNRQAQALKSQKTSIIGIMIADISNSYSSRLIKGVLNGLKYSQYQAIIMDSENSEEVEQKNLKKLLDENVDGIVLQALRHHSEDYEILRKSQLPLVQIDRYTVPLIWPAVESDNFTQSRNLAKLIVDSGYQRIAVVADPIFDTSTRTNRYLGVENALIGTDVSIQEFISTDEQMWEKLLISLKDDVKTAIYAFNGDLVLKTIKFLKDEHITIADGIGLVGYDDSSVAEIVTPTITSIKQNPILIGEAAANKLLRLIESPENAQKPEITYIRSQFSIGESL